MPRHFALTKIFSLIYAFLFIFCADCFSPRKFVFRFVTISDNQRASKSGHVSVVPGGWFDVSGDGGVLKRAISPSLVNGATPRRTSLCTVDIELRIVNDGILNSTVLGNTKGFQFFLKGRNDLDDIITGESSMSTSIKGLHIVLPTMREGEIADIRLSPDYAFGDKGSPPFVPPAATVELRLTLRSTIKYAMGDPQSHEIDSWKARVQNDPLLTQSALRDFEEEDAAVAAAASISSVQASPSRVVKDGEVVEKQDMVDVDVKPPATVRELKAALKAQGLKVSGTKEELTSRFMRSSAGMSSGSKSSQHVGGNSGGRDQATISESDAAKVDAAAQTKRKIAPENVKWEEVALPAPALGNRKAKADKSARFLKEEPTARVDPRTRLKGKEASPTDALAIVRWEETIESIDVLVYFNADKGVPLRKADFEVIVGARKLSVKHKINEELRLLASGDLIEPIDTSASFWWIDENDLSGDEDRIEQPGYSNVIHASLKKRRPRIWAGVWKED